MDEHNSKSETNEINQENNLQNPVDNKDKNIVERPLSSSGPIFTGLSGNELYCLNLIGFKPGNMLVGNSVFSMGLLGGVKSAFKGLVGGEISSYTEMILSGRELSYQRLKNEMNQNGGHGLSSVNSEIVLHGTNMEFLSVGSAIHDDDPNTSAFTTSFDGQELYCLIDAGYSPKEFVFGNVAYSIGIGRGISGAFRQLAKGEVHQYSDIFSHTRQLALERIIAGAKLAGANSIVGIRTSILPFGSSGVQEMIMTGTASNHPAATNLNNKYGVITSDMTSVETWNVAQLGYMPIQLVMGTSVYSLGFIGGFASFLKSFVKTEISQMTEMIYGAREESINKVQQQAAELGADDVLGLKTYVYNLGGGLIEFLVIGTAVKKVDGIATKNSQLPPQAIIQDQDTFVSLADYSNGSFNLNNQNI